MKRRVMEGQSIWEELVRMEKQGNFNRLFQTMADHYKKLGPFRDELFELMEYWLDSPDCRLSSDTAKRVRETMGADIEGLGLEKKLIPKGILPKPLEPGSMEFPAVLPGSGCICRITAMKKENCGLPAGRATQLKRVGSALFEILERKIGLKCVWDPTAYFFETLDYWGKEDLSVEGPSMDLALAVCLFSLLTGQSAPPDILCSARVARSGKIGHVDLIGQKLASVADELPRVRKFVVASSQTIDSPPRQLEIVRVEKLAEAIDVFFPQEKYTIAHLPQWRLESELISIDRLYDAYFLDSCIENAEKVVKLLTSGNCGNPMDEIRTALFRCYWKTGCCYCHKGDTEKSEKFLKMAKEIYEDPGAKKCNQIGFDLYFQSRINYAVALKDLFRYDEARQLHQQLEKEAEEARLKGEYPGKNYGAFSDLCLAEENLADAEKLRRKSMEFMPESEAYRNDYSLGQILCRMGEYDEARNLFDKSEKQIKEEVPPEKKETAWHFFHLYKAEYLYRKAASLTKPASRRPYLAELEKLDAGFLEIKEYPAGLVRKYCGMGLMLQGRVEEGLSRLDQVEDFFYASNSPVFRLIGVTASIEKALHRLATGRPEKAAKKIRTVSENLAVQKDIKKYFADQRRVFGAFSRTKNFTSERLDRARKALEDVKRLIPY